MFVGHSLHVKEVNSDPQRGSADMGCCERPTCPIQRRRATVIAASSDLIPDFGALQRELAQILAV